MSALEREWSFRVGAAFGDATEAFVAAGKLSDETPAVLKLLVPRPFEAARHEITVLRLLRSDETRGALLLERLGRSLHELRLPIGRRHEILRAAASRAGRPAPDAGLPTGADKGRWLIAFITRM